MWSDSLKNSLGPILEISLKVAGLSTFLVMLTAIFLSWWLVHKSSWSSKLVEILIYLPMALPPSALGYGLLLLLGPDTILGDWLSDHNLALAGNFRGAVLAALISSLGIGVRTVRVGLESIDQDYLEMAISFGAKQSQIFRYISWPLLRSSLMGGAILVFIRSLGEFGATMMLAGNKLGETRTLALAIWTTMQNPDHEQEAFLLLIIAAAISLTALVGAELFLKLNVHRSS